MKRIPAIITAAAITVTLSGCQLLSKPESNSGSTSEPDTTTVHTPRTEAPQEPSVITQDIDMFTVVELPVVREELKVNGADPWLYDFRYIAACGYGADDSFRDTEMYYGLSGEISSRSLSYFFYDHTGEVTVKDAALFSENSSEPIVIKDKEIRMDTTKMTRGLYSITADLSNGKTVRLPFYVGDSGTYFCSMTPDEEAASGFSAHREKLYDLISEYGVKPGNSYDLTHLAYPHYPYNDQIRCDTELWADLSSEITEPEWSDAHKLLAIHDWITQNLAFDQYVADNRSPRAEMNIDWSGKYNMYDTRAGVCWDFSNAMITMCRAQNIPAVSVETADGSHMWVAVYVNGIWTDIDPTDDVLRMVYGEDLTDISDSDKIFCYDGYYSPETGSSYSEPGTLNQQLWTCEIDSDGLYVRRPI